MERLLFCYKTVIYGLIVIKLKQFVTLYLTCTKNQPHSLSHTNMAAKNYLYSMLGRGDQFCYTSTVETYRANELKISHFSHINIVINFQCNDIK